MDVELKNVTIEVTDASAGDRLPAKFTAQFNPTEYALTKASQIAEIGIPGIDSPVLQFVRGQSEKLTLELFFDTAEQREGGNNVDVRTRTKAFYQLSKMQPKTHAVPRVRVTWGTGLAFEAIVENVQQRFTLFNPDGVPLRAVLTVTFREYKKLRTQLEEFNLQSSDHTKQRTVRRGDTLSSIAAEEYGDPALWPAIADENQVEDPRRPTPGTVLRLPPLDSVVSSGGVNA